MKISFDQGDGSFEVVLQADEPLPAEWNTRGVMVYKEYETGRYTVVKSYNELLRNDR